MFTCIYYFWSYKFWRSPPSPLKLYSKNVHGHTLSPRSSCPFGCGDSCPTLIDERVWLPLKTVLNNSPLQRSVNSHTTVRVSSTADQMFYSLHYIIIQTCQGNHTTPHGLSESLCYIVICCQNGSSRFELKLFFISFLHLFLTKKIWKCRGHLYICWLLTLYLWEPQYAMLFSLALPLCCPMSEGGLVGQTLFKYTQGTYWITNKVSLHLHCVNSTVKCPAFLSCTYTDIVLGKP